MRIWIWTRNSSPVQFVGTRKSCGLGGGVKKLLIMWKKRLRIVTSNNLYEKIYEYSLHENHFLILSRVHITEKFLGKILIWYIKSVSYVCPLYKSPFYRDFFTVNPSIYGTTVRLKDLSALKGVYFTENPLYFLILPAGLFHSGQLFSSELKRNTIRILC